MTYSGVINKTNYNMLRVIKLKYAHLITKILFKITHGALIMF